MTDKRIDILGMVGELQKHLADDLKTSVKVAMIGKGAKYASGDLFTATLANYTKDTVDPEKWLKLWEAGRITRAQFVNALAVSHEKALDAVGRDALDKISTPGEPVRPLYVNRMKGIHPTLADAVKTLAAVVEAKEAA